MAKVLDWRGKNQVSCIRNQAMTTETPPPCPKPKQPISPSPELREAGSVLDAVPVPEQGLERAPFDFAFRLSAVIDSRSRQHPERSHSKHH